MTLPKEFGWFDGSDAVTTILHRCRIRGRLQLLHLFQTCHQQDFASRLPRSVMVKGGR